MSIASSFGFIGPNDFYSFQFQRAVIIKAVDIQFLDNTLTTNECYVNFFPEVVSDDYIFEPTLFFKFGTNYLRFFHTKYMHSLCLDAQFFTIFTGPATSNVMLTIVYEKRS